MSAFCTWEFFPTHNDDGVDGDGDGNASDYGEDGDKGILNDW